MVTTTSQSKRKQSLRVYFVTHGDGRLTGILIRRWDRFFFDIEPPSAYGDSEQDVLDQLETTLRERELSGDDPLERYLWRERFGVRRVQLDVLPQALIKKQPVIGSRKIPLSLCYAWVRLEPGGAYKVMLPRFGWWIVLEDLETAPEALRQAVSSALLGEHPRWVYDFRREHEEYVREWPMDFVRRALASARERGNDHDPEALRVEFPTLTTVAEELVEQAFRGKLPRAVGADSGLDAEQRALIASDPPPSLLLVGPAGVGKTTWVRQLAGHFAAARRRHGDPPPRIWRAPADRILAGMIYIGQWQERCFELIKELRQEGDYLYVDRLTTLLQPQAAGSSIADLLLPALAAEEISLIAECSEAELARCRQRAPALLGRMTVLRLTEPPTSRMPELMQTYLERKAPRLTLHPLGLRRLAEHLAAFSRHQAFPGKGFAFLDWLAQQRDPDKDATLYARDVSAAFAEQSGLPLQLIADDIPAGTAPICQALEEAVIGQPAACEACARVLTRFKAGTNDPERPLGTLLFVGPTGVGKTELAKQLTRYLFSHEQRMIRLDISEYAARGSAARLLQVGDGVTSLAEQLRQQPLSLVLLDEIEKAHPEVFDLLLGVLGEGRVTDSLGQLVDFRMTLIVMTSNLGASESSPAGFGDRQRDDYLTRVRQHFRPELFNRLDHVLAFSALSPADIERIVELEVQRAASRAGLERRRLRLIVDGEARARLAHLGYHPTRGARPLKRVIEERVITPLAVRLAGEPQIADGEVWVLREGSPAATRLARANDSEVILV